MESDDSVDVDVEDSYMDDDCEIRKKYDRYDRDDSSSRRSSSRGSSSRRRRRSRSRSRSRSRERYYSRSEHSRRHRDDYYKDDYYRDRERDRDRERERDRERDKDRERDREHRYRDRDDYRKKRDRVVSTLADSDSGSHEPTPIIMLRNLMPTVIEDDVYGAMKMDAKLLKDVRLIRDREGVSRGFAFMEFYTTEDAVKWMADTKRDTFTLHGHNVSLEFSQRKNDRRQDDDYYRRRDYHDRDSTRYHKADEGDNPNAITNCIIIKNLDGQSTEQSVEAALYNNVHTAAPISVKVIRDKFTNVSRGFCFVEYNTKELTQEVLSAIHANIGFEIDGKLVTADFARQQGAIPGAKSVGSSVAYAAIAQAQWSNTKTGNEGDHQQNVSSGHKKGGSSKHEDGAKENSSKPATGPTVTLGDGTQCTLPATYLYDATSGFYYDSSTGLYFDPKSQYYYNSQTQQYCYYDVNSQSYVPVTNQPTSSASTNATTTSNTDTNAGNKKKGGASGIASPMNAKEIAKNMERWAKGVNKSKANQQKELQLRIQQEREEKERQAELMAAAVAAASASAPNMLTKLVQSSERIPLSAALEAESSIDMSQISTHAIDPLEQSVDTGQVDWKSLTCLLCKRKFPSRDVLNKHIQFSDLHKQNLQKSLRESGGGSTKSSGQEYQYRDRAKELRDKYGRSEAIIPAWKKKIDRELSEDGPIPYEQSTTSTPLEDDNVGNKMMKAMGWSEGQGLGRDNQGIIDPIKAEKRTQGAGLGSQGGSYGSLYTSAGTYRDTIKQLTLARFNEIADQ